MFTSLQIIKDTVWKSPCKQISVNRCIIACSIYLMSFICSCTVDQTRYYEQHVQAAGGQPISALPAHYWQDASTLDVTVFVYDDTEGTYRTERKYLVSRIPPIRRRVVTVKRQPRFLTEHELHILEKVIASTLSPPLGVKASYHAVPIDAVYSGKHIEEFEADRYLSINIGFSRPNVDQILQHQQSVRVSAVCILGPPEVVPRFTEIRDQWMDATEDLSAHRDRVEKTKAAKGCYFSPPVIKEATLQFSTENGKLSAEGRKEFTDLVTRIARTINNHCFPDK